MEGFRSVEPFIIFALTDLISRTQVAQPFHRAYNTALQHLANEANLSSQERKVIILRLYGHDYNDVADRMNLSIDTVRKHIQSIHRKTGTRSIAELFAKYFSPRITI